MSPLKINLRHLGLQDYLKVYHEMQQFTQSRTPQTLDEIWIVQHPPIFTLGLAGDSDHLIDPGNKIPVVRVDRGGQITYHGPGQILVYLLLDLRRQPFFVKELVFRLEKIIITTLEKLGIIGERKSGSPGIYVKNSKIASDSDELIKVAALGLKVSKHCCYHGFALNVKMDLLPFMSINPCGYSGLKTTDLYTLGVDRQISEIEDILIDEIKIQLNYQ
ncbi:MAG: lipoyl(octanoyl) transferase LipB [Betaproteobacteria bacterium]